MKKGNKTSLNCVLRTEKNIEKLFLVCLSQMKIASFVIVFNWY